MNVVVTECSRGEALWGGGGGVIAETMSSENHSIVHNVHVDIQIEKHTYILLYMHIHTHLPCEETGALFNVHLLRVPRDRVTVRWHRGTNCSHGTGLRNTTVRP